MNVDQSEFVEPEYQRLLGKKTGLVNAVFLMQQGRGKPVASLSQPATCTVGYLADAGGEIDLSVGGKGETVRDTYMSSIGELAERYSLCFPSEDDYLEASHDELADDAPVIDFEYLDIYDEELRGDRLAPLTRDTEIEWTTGTNLLTGEDVYVPADLVNMVTKGDEEQDEAGGPRFLGTSNGAAAGSSLTHALLASLYELIERDAFMRTWCRQETPTRISLERYPEVTEFVDEHVPADHHSVRPVAYDSPLSVPAVGGAIVDERDAMPKFILGGGADVSPSEAIRHAVVESIQGFPFISDIAMNHDPDELDPGEEGDNFEQNVYYYALPEHFDEVEFLFEGEPGRITDHPDATDWDRSRQLDYILEELDRLGYTPIALDETTPDVAQMGIRVTKVIVPELVPITPPGVTPVGHPAFEGERDQLTEKPHPYA